MSTSPPPERITLRSLFQAIVDTFDVNKGFLRSYRFLTTRPGESMRTYLFDDRQVLTNPFRLLFVSTAFVVLIIFNLNKDNSFSEGFKIGQELTQTEQAEGLPPAETDTEAQEKARHFQELFVRYFNLVILFSIPFMALASFWIFGRKEFNYAEHMVFNSYLLSYQNGILIALTPLFIWGSTGLSWSVYMILAYVYFVFACIRFFRASFWKGMFKSLSVILLGSLLYTIAAMVVAMVGVLVYVKVFNG